MNYLLDAKKCLEIITCLTDDKGNEIISCDRSLIPYLQMNFSEILADSLASQEFMDEKLIHTVYYPGCATDIIRCLTITCARILIGVDHIDPSFYPEIENTKEMLTINKNKIVLVNILKQMTQDIKNIRLAYDKTNHDDNQIISADIYESIIIVKLILFGIDRKVIIYVGDKYDGNNCDHLYDGQGNVPHIDTIFLSGFCPDKKVFEIIKPKYIIAPPYEYKYIDKETTLCTIKTKYFNTTTDFFTYDILNTIDTTDPNIIAKAMMLKQYMVVQKFNIIQNIQDIYLR